MLMEQQEVLTQLGTSKEGSRMRVQMQCASLLSDMESFKVKSFVYDKKSNITLNLSILNACLDSVRYRMYNSLHKLPETKILERHRQMNKKVKIENSFPSQSLVHYIWVMGKKIKSIQSTFKFLP